MPGTPRGGGVADASKDGDSAPALAPKGSVWRVGAPTVVLKASAIKERPLVREDDLSTWAGPPLGVSQRGFDTLSLVKTRAAGPALDVEGTARLVKTLSGLELGRQEIEGIVGEAHRCTSLVYLASDAQKWADTSARA
jgi:hypothetical protein